MSFDIVTINILVSIQVRGMHLASSARKASYFVHVAKTLETSVEMGDDFRCHFLWLAQCLVNLADVLKRSTMLLGEADNIFALVQILH